MALTLKCLCNLILDSHLGELYCSYVKSESIIVFKIKFPISLVLIKGQKSVLVMRKIIKYGGWCHGLKMIF